MRIARIALMCECFVQLLALVCERCCQLLALLRERCIQLLALLSACLFSVAAGAADAVELRSQGTDEGEDADAACNERSLNTRTHNRNLVQLAVFGTCALRQAMPCVLCWRASQARGFHAFRSLLSGMTATSLLACLIS